MKQPLDGITVIDLTQIFNGPYATFLMAQAGAEVIKIEPPEGEHLRKRQGSAKGAAMPFAMLNANKRSITLNLKSEAGRQVLKDLVKSADVVVENFAPGVMDRLGLGAKTLQAINPRLIYACSTGYGGDGPYRDYPAMDLAVQAMSGLMETTGYPDDPPVKAGATVCDFAAGTHLFAAIAVALFDRGRTGKGRVVEVAMLDTIFPTLASSLSMYYGSGGTEVARTGNRQSGLAVAPYNAYPTADGYVVIIAGNDQRWHNLVKALGHPELAQDPRFATMRDRCANMDALDEEIGKITRQKSKEDIFQSLVKVRIPSAPVRSLKEVVNDPHLHQRGMLRWIDHPEYGRMVVPSTPIRFTDQPLRDYQPSVGLGVDTEAVLKEKLGIDAETAAKLRAGK